MSAQQLRQRRGSGVSLLIGRLPDVLESTRSVPWTSLDAVGWPTRESVYLQHKAMERQIADRTVPAVYFAQQDASNPTDLIFDSQNNLIALIRVSRDEVVVRRGYEEFTTVGHWQMPGISQSRYGFRELGKFMVPMGDDIRLATLVYLPDGAEQTRFPTILIRTPYGISNQIGRYWHYASRGFALVFQATRGTSYMDAEYRSEGIWEPMIHEPADGAQALEWVAGQSWSDGQICMQGGSYVGYTQWTAAMAGNPALKCIVPESSMGTAFSDQPFMGGGFVEGMAYYMFFMLDEKLLPGQSWNQVLQHRPLLDIDRFATGKDIPQWNTMLENWTNSDYWRRQNWYASEGVREVASFQISGWFDDDFPGTRANWELMQQKAALPQRLIIGPWKHGYNNDRKLNGFAFGPDAIRDDIWLAKQRWYDHFLKGRDAGIRQRQVEYFVLGSNEWRSSSRWPPDSVRPQNWYFESSGRAHQLTSDGTLRPRLPASENPPDVFQYDPEDPAPNWMSFDLMERWEDVQSFPYDFKDIEARHDVVVYTSDLLAEELTIAGDIQVVVYASTDVRDTDWWAHLSDVYPDGQSVRLTTGMLRARFRHLEDPEHHISGKNFADERLLLGDPTQVVRYQIAIPSIANTFRRGHRIRVAIMNAQDKYSFPNSNTGEDEAKVTHTTIGNMKIHHDRSRPSHVVLPVLPRAGK